MDKSVSGIDIAKAREELRKWFVKYTKCTIQTGGWPCGTCTVNFLSALGLDSKAQAYSECNKPRDRMNEVWRAILQMREGKV